MNRKKSFNRPALWEHLLFLGPASIVFLIVIIIPFIISTLSGKIGRLKGVSVKTAYSNVVSKEN